MINVGDKVMIKGGKYKYLEGVVTKIREISADVKIGSIYCKLMIDDLPTLDAPIINTSFLLDKTKLRIV